MLEHLDNLILDLWSIQLISLTTLYIPTLVKLLALLVFMSRSPEGFPVAHKNFYDLEMKQSPTWRELIMKSAGFALKSFVLILHNSSVKLNTDNKAVAFITDSGSNKPHLNAIARDIFCFTSAHGTRLSVEWIPRRRNQKADYYSKIVDFDDWCVSNDYFRKIDS